MTAYTLLTASTVRPEAANEWAGAKVSVASSDTTTGTTTTTTTSDSAAGYVVKDAFVRFMTKDDPTAGTATHTLPLGRISLART